MDRRSATDGRRAVPDGDRLVAVVGLGGVGKSRLAPEVAWCLHASVGWPVLWVDGNAWRHADTDVTIADIGATASGPSVRRGPEGGGAAAERLVS